MRRDSNDADWRKVKDLVSERDKGMCRLLKVLTIPEALKLRKNAGGFLNKVDAAHYRPVSERPDLIYEPNNLVCLNRYSHSNLDDFKDPLDGHCISADEVERWWRRILKSNKNQYTFLEENGLLRENDDAVSDN